MTGSQANIQKARSQWGRGAQEISFQVTKVSGRWTSRTHLWRPPTDVFETDEAFVVRVEIAGMQDAELNISLEGRMMAVHGARQIEGERAAYHQMEVRFGEFLSLVELPGDGDVNQVSATYEDGFLIVRVPKVAY